MKVSGGDYAKVPTRLKAFREANPRASVETNPTFNEAGDIVFKATLIADQADENSARATGHSFGKNTGAKAFEKLETIAVGRALSLLGYLNNGEVASSEEMEDFEQYQEEKQQTVANLFKAKNEISKMLKDKDFDLKQQAEFVLKALGHPKIETLEEAEKVKELLEVA